MYPFMLNKIENNTLSENYYDIESVYGYTGPITNCNEEGFLQDFEGEFLKYCKESNIVAEFIRFHPLIGNEAYFKKGVRVLKNRNTIYIDLNQDIEEIWADDVVSKNRNVIRKGQNSGLKLEISKDFKAFINIYESTMDKVNADKFYYFQDEYFKSMKNDEDYVLLKVVKEDVLISGGVFMRYGQFFHYHLGASLKEYLNYSPNNFLLWEAIKYGKDIGAKYFHLGGGLSDSEDDKLYKFKKSFSSKRSEFCIGKRIHNTGVYEQLIKEWEQKNNKKAKLFLQYKY